MSEKQDHSERLEKAQALVAAIQAGEIEEADRLINDLGKIKENDLFQEVGRLTRELHDAINGFLLDERIADMTQVEIPDAKERLNYVITMTQQSADRTLNAVEECIPLVENLEQRSDYLQQEWGKLRSRLLNKEDFKQLSDELEAFLGDTQQNSQVLHRDLSDVLMAQDFQDLTGQIIRKVIDLVHDLEQKLVMLVRITGGKLEVEKSHENPEVLEGPAVPGIEQGDQVTSQDDVDDLLSSLGF
jgi:chemotaxis protein CheZ